VVAAKFKNTSQVLKFMGIELKFHAHGGKPSQR